MALIFSSFVDLSSHVNQKPLKTKSSDCEKEIKR